MIIIFQAFTEQSQKKVGPFLSFNVATDSNQERSKILTEASFTASVLDRITTVTKKLPEKEQEIVNKDLETERNKGNKLKMTDVSIFINKHASTFKKYNIYDEINKIYQEGLEQIQKLENEKNKSSLKGGKDPGQAEIVGAIESGKKKKALAAARDKDISMAPEILKPGQEFASNTTKKAQVPDIPKLKENAPSNVVQVVFTEEGVKKGKNNRDNGKMV